MVELGGTAYIDCPVQPGALQEYYSLRWTRDDINLLTFVGSQNCLSSVDARYNTDRTNFSLIINSVNVNDSNTNYRCQVFVRNPLTGAKTQLAPYVSLTLQGNAYDE